MKSTKKYKKSSASYLWQDIVGFKKCTFFTCHKLKKLKSIIKYFSVFLMYKVWLFISLVLTHALHSWMHVSVQCPWFIIIWLLDSYRHIRPLMRCCNAPSGMSRFNLNKFYWVALLWLLWDTNLSLTIVQKLLPSGLYTATGLQGSWYYP